MGTYGNLWELMGTYGNLWDLHVDVFFRTAMRFHTVTFLATASRLYCYVFFAARRFHTVTFLRLQVVFTVTFFAL